MANRKRLVDAYEIERLLGVKADWLITQGRNGNIPALRLGRTAIFFELNAVRRALAEMAAQGTRFLRETSADPLREGGADARGC